MSEPWHPTVAAAIAAAQREVRQLGLNMVGSEHLLLGALTQTTNDAVRLCAAFGLSAAAAEVTYRQMASAALGGRRAGVDARADVLIQFTPRAASILTNLQSHLARTEALGLLLLELIGGQDVASAVARETLRSRGQPRQSASELIAALRESMSQGEASA
jgi:ATP-dependent Clp protease ATP-binding subunit ClpA